MRTIKHMAIVCVFIFISVALTAYVDGGRQDAHNFLVLLLIGYIMAKVSA